MRIVAKPVDGVGCWLLLLMTMLLCLHGMTGATTGGQKRWVEWHTQRAREGNEQKERTYREKSQVERDKIKREQEHFKHGKGVRHAEGNTNLAESWTPKFWKQKNPSTYSGGLAAEIIDDWISKNLRRPPQKVCSTGNGRRERKEASMTCLLAVKRRHTVARKLRINNQPSVFATGF